MHKAFQNNGVDACYFDLAKLKKIKFYSARSAIAKLINRAEKESFFYVLPKLESRSFEEIIQNKAPTHILVIGFVYKFLSPDLLAELQSKYDFSLFLYDTDSCNLYSKRREFIYFLDNELPIYKKIFTFSRVVENFLKETKKLDAYHFPFGANPIFSGEIDLQQHEVLFVGSSDLRRIFLLEQIKNLVTVYGNRWQRNYSFISETLQKNIVDKGLWGNALYSVLKSSKIVLNITRTNFYGAETGINLRIFEALAAKCFLLTDYTDEVVELFIPGVEIEVFRSAKELREKVDYYLSHPEERHAIAERGYQKFMQLYTWDKRVKELIEKIDVEN